MDTSAECGTWTCPYRAFATQSTPLDPGVELTSYPSPLARVHVSTPPRSTLDINSPPLNANACYQRLTPQLPETLYCTRPKPRPCTTDLPQPQAKFRNRTPSTRHKPTCVRHTCLPKPALHTPNKPWRSPSTPSHLDSDAACMHICTASQRKRKRTPHAVLLATKSVLSALPRWLAGEVCDWMGARGTPQFVRGGQ